MTDGFRSGTGEDHLMKCMMCLLAIEGDYYEIQMWHHPEPLPDGSGKVNLCRDCGKLIVQVIMVMRQSALEESN